MRVILPSCCSPVTTRGVPPSSSTTSAATPSIVTSRRAVTSPRRARSIQANDCSEAAMARSRRHAPPDPWVPVARDPEATSALLEQRPQPVTLPDLAAMGRPTAW